MIMRAINLVLKHKWYDMIASGEKKEEYREVKPYWEKRLIDYKGLWTYYNEHYKEVRIREVLFPHKPPLKDVCHAFPRGYTHVRFFRGYRAVQTMTFTIEDIDIGRGRPEWGAPDCPVFIIKLGKQVPDKNPEKQG